MGTRSVSDRNPQAPSVVDIVAVDLVKTHFVLIGGERQIEVAVAIIVGPTHRMVGIFSLHSIAHPIGESIAVMMVEKILLIENAVHVAHDVEVLTAIIVVITPVGRYGMIVSGQSHGLGDIGEFVAVISIQIIFAISCDEQIKIAVVVEIGHRRTDTAFFVLVADADHALLERDVGEDAAGFRFIIAE